MKLAAGPSGVLIQTIVLPRAGNLCLCLCLVHMCGDAEIPLIGLHLASPSTSTGWFSEGGRPLVDLCRRLGGCIPMMVAHISFQWTWRLRIVMIMRLPALLLYLFIDSLSLNSFFSGILKIPFLFLTNGGGVPESKRASELSRLLEVDISALQVVQGHSPFKRLLSRFENELIVAVGKGEPAEVMSEYGFKKVLSMDEYASYFDEIDPLTRYKNWTVRHVTCNKSNARLGDPNPRYDAHRSSVQAAFVVSDPVDWGRDVQVLCDILKSGGLPGKENGTQPPLFFASDDLEYQAVFPTERLGMGAFRIALESVFNRINRIPLKYTSFGKPNPFVFQNAEAVLKQVRSNIFGMNLADSICNMKGSSFKTIYMIGDNPSIDIKGAKEAGHPWFSILTRTGVFKGKENHSEFPADLVVDTVEEAVDYILTRDTT